MKPFNLSNHILIIILPSLKRFKVSTSSLNLINDNTVHQSSADQGNTPIGKVKGLPLINGNTVHQMTSADHRNYHGKSGDYKITIEYTSRPQLTIIENGLPLITENITHQLAASDHGSLAVRPR